jgi:hypothetical protein
MRGKQQGLFENEFGAAKDSADKLNYPSGDTREPAKSRDNPLFVENVGLPEETHKRKIITGQENVQKNF